IPDARMLWIRPSTRFLKKYLKANPEITTIITTGPPHSLHLIGRNLKRKLNVHWIADFRDPWSGIDFAEDLSSNERAIRKNKDLEYSVLNEADHVVTISTGVAEELTELSKRKIEVVTNGFEFDLNFDSALTDKFSISHFGSLPNSRNPELLWKVLAELIVSNKEFREALQVDLYGFVDNSITTSVEKHGLKEFVHLRGNLSHKESVLMQRRTQMLLLIVNNQGNVGGTLTGKFFEYLNSKRPILAIGPEDGDLNQAIISTESGCLFNYTDSVGLKKYLLDSFELYNNDALHSERKNLVQFETKNHVSNFIKFVE
ncbi:MAG: glycosyl transferase family 1, partial [Crocinitomicaceae bacterium]